LKAIEDSVSLKTRRYAIIADEAHSSQSGRTANQVKFVLGKNASENKDAAEDEGEDLAINIEDVLVANVDARKRSPNLSYYAFTATPKPKTLELFGRLPDPNEAPSKTNRPVPFHVYSMRQAIEERFILDVLKNYTNYKIAWQLAQKVASPDVEVDARKAKSKLGQWVRLHDYNIAQKVQVIVEHFRSTVAGLLAGHAKAMVVTSSRKEAVRYKLGFDKYVKERGYQGITAMVAFSGEVEFSAQDPNAAGLLGEKFTEHSMNPGLKGRDMRKAFDSDEYHVMIVAQKFQTGFDQPKLCAMYVDKKLGGVECVQTLSRLNRTHPGKEETYVLDFFNDPDDVLAAFQEYYQTAKLLDVSDPNLIWELYDKLTEAKIFYMSEVTLFSEVFYSSSKSQAALSNVCRPALDRWQSRYQEAFAAAEKGRELFERTKKTGDPVLIGNAESELKEAQKELNALGMFKADLMSFTRYYEFMSQIVDYDSTDLEKLSLYARHLAPLLREKTPGEDPIDLSSVQLSHYRLSKIKQQDLLLVKDSHQGLRPGSALGTGKARSKQEEFLSQIIQRLNEVFITDGLTENDLLDYARTITNKISENTLVMKQIENNSAEQALLGDFAGALDDAVMDSSDAHQNQMNQILSNKEVAAGFGRIVFDLLVAQMKGMKLGRVSEGPPSSRR
jgi:type I restriction enzyme R subunit